jgi:hypothetical protein
MKAKRTALPRRRVSFAVDRDEIEINSDWVDAVMNPVAAPPSREVSPAAVAPFPGPVGLMPSPVFPSADLAAEPLPSPARVEAPPPAPVFFVPEENSSTDAKSATDERCTSVEKTSAVDKVASVAQTAAVANQPSVEEGSTVADLATVEHETTGKNGLEDPISSQSEVKSVVNNATVETSTTVESLAPVEDLVSTKDHRTPRRRPILRITDGLTPGQYAVYSLMYDAGEQGGDLSRIYKGGYADLCRLTGLSKRGIQNIIAELQAKQVIRIHQHPGYHRTETSAYLVPGPESVLHTWFANGWRNALGKSKTLVN